MYTYSVVIRIFSSSPPRLYTDLRRLRVIEVLKQSLSVPISVQHDENASQPPITAVMRKTKRADDGTKGLGAAQIAKRPRKALGEISNVADPDVVCVYTKRQPCFLDMLWHHLVCLCATCSVDLSLPPLTYTSLRPLSKRRRQCARDGLLARRPARPSRSSSQPPQPHRPPRIQSLVCVAL